MFPKVLVFVSLLLLAGGVPLGLRNPINRQAAQLILNVLANSELRDHPSVRSLQERFNSGGDNREKRNLDMGGILQMLGIDFNLGGPQIGFTPPNVSVDAPGSQISCNVNKRDRREDRKETAESLESNQNVPDVVSF